MTQPGSFVLVHGAFHGGWCWRRVSDRLATKGARVFSPTLTGLGERSHLARPDIDLSTHVADVVNLILWEDLAGVILCGHSYAGMVINGVAEAIPERIAALVYLDAVNGMPGQCVWDCLTPDMKEFFEARTKDGFIRPISAEDFVVPAGDRAWVDTKCTAQPLATFHEPLPRTNHRAGIASTYISASDYPLPMLAGFAQRARDSDSCRFVELHGGHDLMLDTPDAVTEALLAASAQDLLHIQG